MDEQETSQEQKKLAEQEAERIADLKWAEQEAKRLSDLRVKQEEERELRESILNQSQNDKKPASKNEMTPEKLPPRLFNLSEQAGINNPNIQHEPPLSNQNTFKQFEANPLPDTHPLQRGIDLVGKENIPQESEPENKGFNLPNLMSSLLKMFPTRQELFTAAGQMIPTTLRHLDNTPGAGGDVMRLGRASIGQIATAYWGKAVTAINNILTGNVQIVGGVGVSVTNDEANKTLAIFNTGVTSIGTLYGGVGVTSNDDSIGISAIGQNINFKNNGVTKISDLVGAVTVSTAPALSPSNKPGINATVAKSGNDIKIGTDFVSSFGNQSKFFLCNFEWITSNPAANYFRLRVCWPGETNPANVAQQDFGPIPKTIGEGGASSVTSVQVNGGAVQTGAVVVNVQPGIVSAVNGAVEVVTNLRYVEPNFQKKTKIITYTSGVVTNISAESGWVDITVAEICNT
jgi:hypothetical protein